MTATNKGRKKNGLRAGLHNEGTGCSHNFTSRNPRPRERLGSRPVKRVGVGKGAPTGVSKAEDQKCDVRFKR